MKTRFHKINPQQVPTEFSLEDDSFSADTRSSSLRGRCLFRNECMCIRLLEVPGGYELSPCLRDCAGLLVVSAGSVELLSNGNRQSLVEGDMWKLSSDECPQIRAVTWANVVLFQIL